MDKCRVDAEIQDWKRSQTIKSSGRIWKAIESHELHLLPKRLFSRKSLLLERQGWNAFHVAAYFLALEGIPKRFLIQKNLRTWSRMFGGNVFHVAAEWSGFFGIPSHLRTPENMLCRNSANVTPLGFLARSQYFHLIPRRLLVAPNLLLVDDDGDTVLHRAAMGRNLVSIPWRFHTEAMFSILNSTGNNVLHLAACSAGMKHIKERVALMTPAILLAKNNQGETPIGLAARHGDLWEIPISAALAQHCQVISDIVWDAVNKAYLEDEVDDERSRRFDARSWLAELTKLSLRAGLTKEKPEN